jgi:chitin synthase
VLALYLVSQATKKLVVNSVLYEDAMQSAVWNNLGSHIVASLLYMDPLHLITSTWAYFAGTNCFSNILMVYAFCNWHDVSIGTKVVDKSDALPEAQTKKDEKSKFIEELDRPQIDIDTLFQATVKRALATFEPPQESNEKDVDDLYKAFRTYLILLWVFSNLAMVLGIMCTEVTRFCLSVGTISDIYHDLANILNRPYPISVFGIIFWLWCGQQSEFPCFVLSGPSGFWQRRLSCAASHGNDTLIA